LRDLDLEPETTMSNERMEPLELVEKAADADLGRELLAFAAARIMDARGCGGGRRGQGRVQRFGSPGRSK
jgi:hypothetical protein